MASSPTTRHRAAVFAYASLIIACGGGSDSSITPVVVPPAVVASVTVTPATLNLTVGTTGSLSASALTAAGAAISGKTASWTTSNAAVATVSGGTVTAIGAGTASITADVDGKTASSAITVVAPLPALLEVVSGDAQKGLTGRALADSLVVRAKTAAGAPAPNVAITLTASSGTLSSTTATTDATGVARVQWVAGTGDATATVAMAGSANLTLKSNGRTSGACVLAPVGQRMTLGPSDPTLSLNPTAPHKIALLYADFSDAPAPASDTFQSLVDLVVTPGLAMLKELSYGRIQITTTIVPKWYRMSGTSDSYTWRTFQGHHDFIGEVMTLADADVDFSQYDAVYVFTPAAAKQPISPTFNAGQSTGGLKFDGKIIGNGVTFGQDARKYGFVVLAHETQHMFGLVDLYNFTPRTAGDAYPGDQFQNFGAWSIMSNIFVQGHTLAWEKRKLGFLDASQVDCIEGTGGEEVVVQPLEVAGGIKMVALPLDASRAVVIEVRSNQGIDAGLCSTGVLIYDVDASAASGVNVGKIRASRATNSGPLYTKCGAFADATYGLGANDISSYTDSVSGISVKLLGVDASGAYRLRIKR
ncbi:MAG: peptidase [Gemmatimonadetes bacterium]|nr:peptidase [Gemmatimonadota bacterium]